MHVCDRLSPILEDEKLRQDLEKVEQLESKIKTELSELQNKIDQMSNDLGTYSDTEIQRREAEDLKQVRLSICRSGQLLYSAHCHQRDKLNVL